MAAARKEAGQKVQEAYQEGLARGMHAGQERFEASLAHCAEALEAAVSLVEWPELAGGAFGRGVEVEIRMRDEGREARVKI